jgi:predicted small secreted protein
MKWKTLIFGAAAGFAAGYATKQVLEQSVTPSPEKILSHVKSAVRKDGKIYGSWILMKPESYQKNNLNYTVYKGGISRQTDGNQEHFEFVADATTGTIIELTSKE